EKVILMQVEIDLNLSARQNAAKHFDAAKEAKRKREAALASMEEVRKQIALEEEKSAASEAPRVRVKEARKREWFEAFRWFRTSGGFLVVAGRDAKQNELLAAKYLREGDLFFHADVHGAPATILKDGQKAGEKDLLETACWAASYSSAWKGGFSSCDVYAVKPDQVSKYSHGEFVAKGGFMIYGERKWFRGVPLGLWFFAREGILSVLPVVCPKPAGALRVVPGRVKKTDFAKMVIKILGLTNNDGVLAWLPGDADAA
ncbi:MAG: NFACT RNA binding domain-containing protein, partial [Candidatus Norongarragalinales archaeon]